MKVSMRRWMMALAIVSGVMVLAGPVMASGGLKMFFINDKEIVGSLVIWFLILISMAQVALIIQAFLQTRLSVFMPRQTITDLEAMLTEKKFREAIEIAQADASPFGQIINSALAQAPRGYLSMEQAMEETAESIGGQKIRGLVWLEIAGAAGPMCGLFGTVYGMIVSFSEIAAKGGAVSASELSGGIGTALVCTFWGLVVGIPGVTFAALFRVKLEGLTSSAMFECAKLIGQFRPAPGGAKKSPAPASPKPAEPTA